MSELLDIVGFSDEEIAFIEKIEEFETEKSKQDTMDFILDNLKKGKEIILKPVFSLQEREIIVNIFLDQLSSEEIT